MHITLAQKDLEQAAMVVSNLADKAASTMPVLSNLLIEATDKGVQFRGTDMETVVHVNVNATVIRPGLTTVPADTFKELVRLMPANSEVSIEESGRKILIACETNEYKLMTLPAEDFPAWESAPHECRFQIGQKTLKALIEATTYALPMKDHRRVLLGVHFEVFDNTLRLTSTDGKKLARMSTNLPELEGASTSITIPRKLLDNLTRFLGSEGPVDVELSPRQAVFRFANVTYRGNGIDGKYPDCDMVIPKEFPTELMLNRDVFLQATRRAGVVTDEKNKSIILKFANNACEFSSMAHDLGTFSGKIGLDYTAEPVELAFNFQYLIETLGRFTTPEVRMFIKNSKSPVVFRNREEETRLALLMPIKLSDVRPAAMPDDEEA